MTLFFAELQRRNVFRVAVLYVVVAWILLQASDIVMPLLELPEWTGRFVLFVLGLGFPIALFFAWVYEITPEGIKKEKDIDRSESVVHTTGRKIDFVIIAGLVVALGYFAFNHDWGGADTTIDETTVMVTRADGKKSIAVLPFSNLSEDNGSEFFTSGVHEDILTYLSRVNDLHVISRTSVLRYADTHKDLREIANELEVDHIVEGSVRRSGNQVRITAQLIDANSDGHLWADNYDRELTDVFAIQTEVAQAIVAALEAELSPNEQRLLATRPTQNIEAYDYYLQARERVRDSDYSVAKYQDAKVLYEKALHVDPDFALAWIGLAEVYGQYYWQGADTDGTAQSKARQAIERAMQASPGLPESHVAMGEYYYRFQSDFSRSLEEFKKALLDMPANGDLWARIALSQRRNHQFDDSIQSFLKSQELDPGHMENDSAFMETLDQVRQWDMLIERANVRLADDPSSGVYGSLKVVAMINGYGDVDGALDLLASIEPVGDNYYVAGGQLATLMSRDMSEIESFYSIPVIKNYLDEDTGFVGWVDFALGEAYVLLGDREKGQRHLNAAKEKFEQQLAGFKEAYFTRQLLAETYAYQGDCDAAKISIDRARALMPESKDSVFGVYASYGYAKVMSICGEIESALDALEHQLAVPAGVSVWRLRLSPEWDPLRDHPRFQALITGTGS